MPVKSLILSSPPYWRSLGGWSRSGTLESPHAIQSWLLESGSLTERLKKRYGSRFGVRLLQQHLGIPYAEEQLALQLQPGTRAIIREVALMAGTNPVIMARSVIPRDTVRYADPRLDRLGSQPLGEILFSHPELGRNTLEWTRTKLSGQLTTGPVTGRRSLYSLGNHFPLLVAEFFLPELLMEGS